MSLDTDRGPGEDETPFDVTAASEPGWDLELGHMDDFEPFSGIHLTDLMAAEPLEVSGLGERNDPPLGDMDDFPRLA